MKNNNFGTRIFLIATQIFVFLNIINCSQGDVFTEISNSDTDSDTDSDSDSDGDFDTDTDSDSNTDSDSETVCNESGFVASGLPGVCWYISDESSNCTDTCQNHGGYNEATRTYSGSDGTDAACEDVLDSMGFENAYSVGSTEKALGTGCSVLEGDTDHYFRDPVTTNAKAVFELGRRACACNQ